MSRTRSLISWLLTGMCTAAQAASDAPAGTVTLTIGQATLVTQTGTARVVETGALVRAGDRIETTAGGHVHVRFRDGGLVSVRPSSRLVVEEYRYEPGRVADSVVRFRLEKGTARAISGAAAEGAKERFRLNTPLVAIGVRGTDFVVQTDERHSVASVSQGAIVVAPLGEGCAPAALGPCSTLQSRVLAADAGGLLFQLRDGIAEPEVKPVVAVRRPLAAPQTPGGGGSSAAPHDPAVVDPADASTLAVLDRTLAAPVATPQEPSPPSPSAPPAPPPPALQWGRWGDPRGVSDFSVPRAQARLQGTAVAYGSPYLLVRNQPADASWPASTGTLGFALQAASAQYEGPPGVQEVVVGGGTLTVDFHAARYRTELRLNAVPADLARVTADGVISRQGTFETVTSAQRVAGAVTLDTQAAAYWFQKAGASGMVSGITLWGR